MIFTNNTGLPLPRSCVDHISLLIHPSSILYSYFQVNWRHHDCLLHLPKLSWKVKVIIFHLDKRWRIISLDTSMLHKYISNHHNISNTQFVSPKTSWHNRFHYQLRKCNHHHQNGCSFLEKKVPYHVPLPSFFF